MVYWNVFRLHQFEEKKCFYLSRPKANYQVIIKGIKSARFRIDIVAKNRNSPTLKYSKYDGVELKTSLNDIDKGLITKVSICSTKEYSYQWHATSFTCFVEVFYGLHQLGWPIELPLKSLKSHFHHDRIPTFGSNTASMLWRQALCNNFMALSPKKIGFDVQETKESESTQTSSKKSRDSRHINHSTTPKRSTSRLRTAPIMHLASSKTCQLMKLKTRISKRKIDELAHKDLSCK